MAAANNNDDASASVAGAGAQDGITGPTTTSDTNESLTNLKRDREGYFARFAQRLFGDPTGFLGSFADDQRLARLEGCKDLESNLADCERIRDAILSANANSASDVTSTIPSNSSTSQLKINRFYGWGVGGSGASDREREEEARIMEQHEDTNSSAQINVASRNNSTDMASTAGSADGSTSCSRESHSVWACRALALGCADHLVPLRKCLRETKSDGIFYDNTDGAATSVEGACALEQIALAKCVASNTADLKQRCKKRE